MALWVTDPREEVYKLYGFGVDFRWVSPCPYSQCVELLLALGTDPNEPFVFAKVTGELATSPWKAYVDRSLR